MTTPKGHRSRRYRRLRFWAWITVCAAFVLLVGVPLLGPAFGLHVGLYVVLVAAGPIGMFGSFLFVRSSSVRDATSCSEAGDEPAKPI